MTKQYTYTKNKDGFMGSENRIENYRTGEVTQLRRIADSLDEILRLVKADQEQFKKKEETAGDDSEDRAGHY